MIFFIHANDTGLEDPLCQLKEKEENLIKVDVKVKFSLKTVS